MVWIATTVTGRTRCLSISRRSNPCWPGGYTPATGKCSQVASGNHCWVYTANTICSRIAEMNGGIDSITRAVVLMPPSRSEPGFSAANTPHVIPIGDPDH